MKGEDEDVLAQEFVRDFITFTGTLLAMEIVLVIASGVGLYVPGWIIIPTYSKIIILEYSRVAQTI